MLSFLIQSSLNASKCAFLQTTTRSKHSKTQVKRLFKKHPAFHRVASRNDALPKRSEPPTITYEPLCSVEILPNGWSVPSTDESVLSKRNEIPFGIRRTGNKPNNTVGFLPIYSNVRLGGTKHTTIVKKVTGDQQAFMNELMAVLKISPEDKEAIRMRASGTTVELNGNRVREVKTWLTGLGF
jgi:large subunit ribosomal protein L49